MENRVLSLSYGRIIVRPAAKLRGLVPESFETYQIVEPGNIIVRTTDLQNDRTSLRVGQVRTRGIITAAYMCLEPRDGVTAEYGYQLLNAYDHLKVLYGFGSGLRQSLDFRHIKRMPVALPPPDEQAAIVRFLDHADRSVRRVIRAKQKLVKLLEEQKQAVIHEAVTRGLDPSSPMKESGILWAATLPAHWPVLPTRKLLRVRKVLVGARHSEFQLLSLTKGGIIVRDLSAGGKNSNYPDRCQEVRPGDFVFCLFDVEETPRTVGLSAYHGMISGDYTVMECLDPTAAHFVERFYQAMDDRKLMSPLYSGLRKRIPKPLFLASSLPLPPLHERASIVEFIERELAQIEPRVGRIQMEIALLRELHTRIITDVVTGQLDVRAAAFALRDEFSDSDPVDDMDETSDDDLGTDADAVSEDEVT